MTLRQSVPSIRVAGLERAARMAGEAFGHEDLGPLPRFPSQAPQTSHLVWLLAALAAIAGFAALILR